MRGRFGVGPVGTGSHLVGHKGPWSLPQDVEVWFLVLFFPLVPLSRWSVSAATEASGGDAGAAGLELTVHSRSRVGLRASLSRVARSLGVAALAACPLAFAVWRIGTPWATPVLTSVFGSLLSSGLLDKLGMAIEMGVVLVGAVIPVVVLMLLDETLPRVPLRSAIGFKEGGRS